jgi:hypothetical protein
MCLDSEGNTYEALKEKMEKNLATFVKKIEPETKVILRLDGVSSSGQQVVSAVSNFIREYKITEKLFSKITVLSEKWVDLSIQSGEEIEQAEYNLGQVFKVCSQNNTEIFYSSPAENGKKSKVQSLT